MSTIPTLDGISSRMIQTDRLNIHALLSGDEDGTPIIFIHGNCSSATFWEETMLRLPDGFRAIALDQRGYGDTEPLLIDATQGLDDMAADVRSLAQTLGIEQYHLVGHSMGGNVCMKLMLAAPDEILSVTLAAPGSPYGYGGSKPDGSPVHADGAPAGGGTGNPDFVRLIAENERGDENPMSPRNVMRAFYYKPPFVPEREEALLSSLLSTRTGENHYPGNFVSSDHWPTVAPGDRGILNALSRHHYDASGIANIDPKPPVLWIRGADDQIVADMAMFEIAALGAMGAVPGYPGADVCPPQPMIAQTKAVFDQYEANGGTVHEVVLDDVGHTPYIEKPAEFDEAFHQHIQ